MKDGREGQRLYRQPELLINTEGLLGHSQHAGSIFVLQDGRAAQAYILS